MLTVNLDPSSVMVARVSGGLRVSMARAFSVMRAFSVIRAFSGGLIRMVSTIRAMMIVAVLLPRCLARDQCLRAGTGARRAQRADVDLATFSGGFTHTDYHDVPPAGFEYQ